MLIQGYSHQIFHCGVILGFTALWSTYYFSHSEQLRVVKRTVQLCLFKEANYFCWFLPFCIVFEVNYKQNSKYFLILSYQFLMVVRWRRGRIVFLRAVQQGCIFKINHNIIWSDFCRLSQIIIGPINEIIISIIMPIIF